MLNSKQIRFDLLTNATDSLRQAVELMAWKEVGHEHAPLKHAISHAAHAFELLLKERLRRTNAALSWENVDIRALKHALSRWKETFSICIQTAISRLKKIAAVHISDDDAKQIKSPRTTRNAIEHYQWETTEREARVIVGNALSFAFSFAQDHLGADLSATFSRMTLGPSWLTTCMNSRRCMAGGSRLALRRKVRLRPTAINARRPLFRSLAEVASSVTLARRR